MKFYGVALVGIITAGAVLTNVAYADTVIASKAYVDSAVDAKQNKLKTGSGGNITVSAGSGSASQAITGVSANGDGTVTFTTQSVATDVSGKADKANLSSAGNTFSLVKYNTQGIVTEGQAYVASGNIQNNTIMDEDISTSAAIAYTKMNGQLSSVNVGSGNYSSDCTEGAPCVLTFYVKNGTTYYRWTNMNPEGLTAL